MDPLLRDEVAAYGPDDHRPLELLRPLGVLGLGARRREEAGCTLRSLREDLVRLRGEEHPTIAQIDDLLRAT